MSNAKTAYLAGPMSGYKDWNYPAFHEAAAKWRAKGWDIINPAENHEGATDLPLAEYFKADLPQVCDANAVIVLPGWQESRGASIEVMLARHLGKPVLDVADGEPFGETVAEEANRIVNGPRQASYGHPVADFTRTGRLWGSILGREDIPPETVGLMMAALKISREVNRPNRDNRVDAIGYMLTTDLCEQYKESLSQGASNGSN